ncbi:catalase [Pseudomonas sp. S11P7]|uniref:catalase n=1 Tax=Pseudomonas sp. S11P7 TaxID=3029169 RepID=UPI00406CD5A0
MGYRHMHGFGSHTYSLINAGRASLGEMALQDPSRASRTLRPRHAARLGRHRSGLRPGDLFEAIEGDAVFPNWRVCIQIMTGSRSQAAAHYENPFDVTKTWSQKGISADRSR